MIIIKYKIFPLNKKVFFDKIKDEHFFSLLLDIENSFKETAKDKAVSWDLIPGICLKELYKAQKENSLIYEKLANIFNRYIKFNAIQKEITTFRLFCLNKKADEVGNVDNLRPIAISSTFIKMIESTIYTRLSDKINYFFK